MSYRKCVEIWIILEKFHILGAVGIESGEGQKPVGEGGRVGWGAIGEIQPLPTKGHAKLTFSTINTGGLTTNKQEQLA